MEVIFRMAGILLIMGSTVWTGATLAAREKYRLRDLGELERGVLLLEGQIAYLSAPLPEALWRSRNPPQSGLALRRP